MRETLIAIVLACGASAASSEEWMMRHGTCDEWQTTLTVEQNEEGLWTGTAQHVLVGGPCVQGAGMRATSQFEAVIAGDRFFGYRHWQGGYCAFNGRIEGDQAQGTELCSNSRPLTFTLSFGTAGEPGGPDFDEGSGGSRPDGDPAGSDRRLDPRDGFEQRRR
jgi:hypothetical protein